MLCVAGVSGSIGISGLFSLCKVETNLHAANYARWQHL